VVEVWPDKFVLAADPGGVEYDAGQIDELMAARFKKRRAEAQTYPARPQPRSCRHRGAYHETSDPAAIQLGNNTTTTMEKARALTSAPLTP
jgi:hypothetical protein